jgi:signal peptidase I
MPPRTRRCSGDLGPVVVATTSRTALWLGVLLALWCVVPAALGWHVTTVASDSMAPRLRTGDVVAAAPIDGDDVRPGQVLLVDDPDHADRLRLHRLVSHELRLRGDANAAPDSSLVAAEAVHGVGILRVPWVGAPGTWLRGGDFLPLVVLVVGVGVLTGLARLDHPTKSEAPCPRCGRPRWESTAPPIGTAPRSVPPTVVVAAVLVVACLVSMVPSGAAFSGATGSDGRASTGLFPCMTGPLLDDPVLAWDFDGPRGDAHRDASGHGRDGRALSGAIRNDGSCEANPSVDLRSDDARVVSTTREAAPSTFSVEAWFRTDRPGGRIVGFGSSDASASANKDRQLYVTSQGLVSFGVQGSSDFRFTVASRSRVDDGEWHHVVGTFRPGALDLWLDGVHQAGRADNRGAKTYDGSWRVGRDSLDPWPGQPADYSFRGDVDTVRVYDRQLDEVSVASHHAAGR